VHELTFDGVHEYRPLMETDVSIRFGMAADDAGYICWAVECSGEIRVRCRKKRRKLW